MTASWMPLFPLDIVLLPGGDLPLHIFEPRYRKMMDRCISEESPFGVVRAKQEGFTEVGCEALVVKLLRRYPDGRLDIMTRGGERIRVVQVRDHEDGYTEAEIVPFVEDEQEADHELEDRIVKLYRKAVTIAGDLPNDPPPRGSYWSYRLAERLRLSIGSRQELLELPSERERIQRLEGMLRRLIPTLVAKEKAQRLIRGNGRMRGRLRIAGDSNPEGGTS